MERSRLLAGLNAAQLEAVTHPGGPLLIVAGAGSGKTRVITRRIAWSVALGTPPEQILALTFSTKAAEEMRNRAEDLLDQPYEQLWCSTFHAFCARVLQEEALEAGLDPFFQPVTPADRLALLMDRAQDLSLRRHQIRGNPAGLLAKLIERVDRLKDEMVTAAEYRAWAESLIDSALEAGEVDLAERELEFARFYADHDRILDEAGLLDFGGLIFRTISILRERPHVYRRVSARFHQVLVDEYQDTNFAQAELLRLLVREHRNVTVVGDDDQAIYRFRGASRKNIVDFQQHFPEAKVVQLEINYRSDQKILDAAHAVIAQSEDRLPKRLHAAGDHVAGGLSCVSFWRCQSERAQAHAVAAEIEELIAVGLDPGGAAVLVRSVRNEGALMAAALEERGIPFRVTGAGAFFERTEVRDVLAWLRLLLDPNDARAVVRALIRPPVELSPVDLARSTQIARRRKLDMVSALHAALQAPVIPPDACERIETFLRLYRSAARAFDEMRPDRFIHRLIDRIGLRKQQLLVDDRESRERLVNIARLADLASSWVRRKPAGTAREFASYIVAAAEAGLREEEAGLPGAGNAVHVMTMHSAKGLEFDNVYVLGLQQARMPGPRRQPSDPISDALLKEPLPENTRETHIDEMRRLLYVAMTRARRRLVLAWPERTSGGDHLNQKPSPFYEQARSCLDAAEEAQEEQVLGIDENLFAAFRSVREELLGGVAQVGERMNEMRLDAHLDAATGVARYLELLKLGALIDRPPNQNLGEAIADMNRLLLEGASAQQREAFLSSGLDERLIRAETEGLDRRELVRAGRERSLESFIPKRGDGVMLSATDIEIYRVCPLRYKYARIYAIPREQTLSQRFGILMHQVLERFHSQIATEQASNGGGPDHASSAEALSMLLAAGWRRSGFGDSDEELHLHRLALEALDRYYERFLSQDSTPVWFERSFSFKIGSHQLRGRVDRVDRHADGSFELIDYKTGKARTPAQLKDDIQLPLYHLGAKQSWKLEASRQSYYYLLDDEKVALKPSDEEVARIEQAAVEVAEGILSQDFEPKPSWSACNSCDFQLICPAAEK